MAISERFVPRSAVKCKTQIKFVEPAENTQKLRGVSSRLANRPHKTLSRGRVKSERGREAALSRLSLFYYLTVGHQNIDLWFVVGIVKALHQRNALQVLRFFQRMGDVIRSYHAKTQLDAFAH